MATIAEVRAKYPQYADMPDAALADALYNKFYSDVPRADFDAKIGLPANETPAPRQLTTGQRMYQTARPYVAPLVEAGGAIAGGLVGGTAGTFGAGPIGTVTGGVAGAGLGYGIAKEALEAADVAMGMKQPRTGAAQVTEPIRNVLEGATMEVGGRVAVPLIAKGVGAVIDLRQIPVNKAAQIARNALGPDLPEVLNALKTTQGGSAAQATANINSPTFQALINRATARDPRFLASLEKSQGEVSLNALSKLAGGVTAAETRGTTEAAKEAARSITSPMRETSLSRANLGRAVAGQETEAQRLAAQAASEVENVRFLKRAETAAERAAVPKGPINVEDIRRYTYPLDLAKKADEWASQAATASLDLGQGARFAQGAADALRSVGIKPLEGAPLVRSLKSVGNNPEFAGNDLLQGSLQQVADDIATWTRSGGVIDARALDAIRKNSVNAAIQKLRPGLDATSQRNAAAGVLGRVKPVIDDAIEAAGGVGYRDYLKEHAKLSQKIAEKQLTGEALRLFKTDKDAFVRLVQNESPEAVEKILGAGKYNIATELSDNTMSVLRDQAQKHLTELAVKGQVSAGQTALKELLLQNMSKFRLPSYLSAVTATTNKALNILENKIGQKTMSALTEGLKTPETAAKLLESLPAAERSRVLQLLSNPTQWSEGGKAVTRGATAIGVNALAPEPTNRLILE
jgi:hypothetical protein